MLLVRSGSNPAGGSPRVASTRMSPVPLLRSGPTRAGAPLATPADWRVSDAPAESLSGWFVELADFDDVDPASDTTPVDSLPVWSEVPWHAPAPSERRTNALTIALRGAIEYFAVKSVWTGSSPHAHASVRTLDHTPPPHGGGEYTQQGLHARRPIADLKSCSSALA